MNLIILIILITIGINLFLSILIFLKLRKHNPIDKKDKDFIVFVIDMYIQYAHELDIYSEEQHDKLVKQLEKIKKRYFNK